MGWQRVELDGLAGDEQEGGIGQVVADSLAQVGQGMAQVSQGGWLGVIRPEQARQGLAGVRAARFSRQVGQQRSHFVGCEAGDRLAIPEGLERSQ